MIWLLASRWEAGGLERVLLNLSRALNDNGVANSIIAGRALGGPGHPDEVQYRAPRGALEFLLRLPLLVARHKPSVLCTTSNDVAIWLLAWRRWLFPGTAIVAAQHLSLSAPRTEASGLRRLKLVLIRHGMRCMLPKAEAVVAVSEGVASDLSKELGIERAAIHVIYNPLAEDGAHSEATPEARVTWPFQDDHVPVIAFAGRLVRVKRLDLLLGAFLEVLKVRPAHLLVLGDGPASDMLKQAIKAAGVEHMCALPGRVIDIRPWLIRSAVLVLPSDYEGFGNVLVEAMLCGTQVVSTDCPSGPAEILEHGRFGQLVPVGDRDALTQALLASLAGTFRVPAEVLRKRGGQFSINKARDAYAKVFEGARRRRY